MSATPPSATLLSQDPPIRADDYVAALWVPVARLLSARRRVLSMAEKLPAAAWEEPSAVSGWRRKDVLAHLAAHEVQHHRSIKAILDGAPLRSRQADPDDESVGIHAWNLRQVAARQDAPLAQLVEELNAGMAETLRLLAQVEQPHLLHSYGFAPNLLAGLEKRVEHEHMHADDIVNGPSMMR